MCSHTRYSAYLGWAKSNRRIVFINQHKVKHHSVTHAGTLQWPMTCTVSDSTRREESFTRGLTRGSPAGAVMYAAYGGALDTRVYGPTNVPRFGL